MTRQLPLLLVVASAFGIGLGVSVLAELGEPQPVDASRLSWIELGEAQRPEAVSASVEAAAAACPQIVAERLMIDCAAPPCIVYERAPEPGPRPLRDCAAWPHRGVDALSIVEPGVGEITAYVIAPPAIARRPAPRLQLGLAVVTERWRAPAP